MKPSRRTRILKALIGFVFLAANVNVYFVFS